MIKYSLICTDRHQFEAWFKDSAAFDNQKERGLLQCALCGSKEVKKAIMAPNIAKLSSDKRTPSLQETETKDFAETAAQETVLREIASYVERNFKEVGADFTETAKKMHYGEIEKEAIYGTATLTQIKELHDEEIYTLPLPALKKIDA